MPTTYQKCDPSVAELAASILCSYPEHKGLLDAKVKIDYLFAYSDSGCALKCHGVKALAIARKLSLKDRAKGMGDCQVEIDHHWWEYASEQERRAVLDHELHHFTIGVGKNGIERDDIGRPKIFLRKHDFQFGWFDVIAERHGQFSQERQQAQNILHSEVGQFYFPGFARA